MRLNNVFKTILIGMVTMNAQMVYAGQVTVKIKQLHQKMAKYYFENGGKKGMPIAVLRFDTDEKLAKLKIGNAVAEILTHYFARDPNFKTVERIDLEKILKEQKLSLTGVIDEETIINAGQIIGAQLLVLGSVLKVGKDYQINSRLVNVEDGKILGAHFAAIPSEEFEKEAEMYLALVPKKQIIGLYGSVGFWNSRANVVNKINFSQNSFSTPIPENFSVIGVPAKLTTTIIYSGIGLRYFPFKSAMLDCWGSLTQNTVSSSLNLITTTDGKVGSPFGSYNSIGYTIKNPFNTTINYVQHFGKKLSLITGVGTSYFDLSISNSFVTSITFLDGKVFSAVGNASDTVITQKYFFLPMTRLGFEWRPQERLGINVLANYLVTEKTFTVNLDGRQFLGPPDQKGNFNFPLMELTIGNELIFNSVIVFYF